MLGKQLKSAVIFFSLMFGHYTLAQPGDTDSGKEATAAPEVATIEASVFRYRAELEKKSRQL